MHPAITVLYACSLHDALPICRQVSASRGEVRSDIVAALIVSILDWTMERFQDALLTEELDPGLFPHPADPEKNQARINQFLLVLRGAIGI